MKKVGLIMRRVQFAEAQGPRIFADQLEQIAKAIGVEIVPIVPERWVTDRGPLQGYEFEKGDLVNYDIVVDKLHKNGIEHVIYTVAGFSFLKQFGLNCVLFPHSFPDPALAGSDMMKPFYQMVDKAIVQTDFIKSRINEMGVSDVTVIPIGFEEELAKTSYQPSEVVSNRVLWIGRDESNRQPEIVLQYAKENPHAEVIMVFGGERYRETMTRFEIPSNVQLKFALSRLEIFELMNTAKVYWSSSRFDTFAMPLVEAMAMGKIIVKPEHACYSHIRGRHVFAGNRENWFDLVNLGLQMPLIVSEENREYAFEHFTSTKMRQGYEAFFTNWLGL